MTKPTFRPEPVYSVQVIYKPDQLGGSETELLRFGNHNNAQMFLESILKNPDVQSARMV